MKRVERINGLRKQKGLTLIEIAIVLLILGGIMGLMYWYLAQTNERSVMKDEAQAYNTMIADVRTKFRAQGSYTGVSPQALVQLGVVPPTMVNGNAIRSGWNTPVTVAAINLSGSAGDGIEFTYQVPRRSCADFVDSTQGASTRVVIGGTTVKNQTTGGAANTLNVAQVATACDAQTGGNVQIALAQGR